MTQTSQLPARIRSMLAAATMLGVLAGTVSAKSAAQATGEPTRPRVMILGKFHFEGSTADGISITMGDMLSPRRQAEIEVAVDRLAQFQPTQIMVEATPDREAEINEIYRAYLGAAMSSVPTNHNRLGCGWPGSSGCR